MRKNLENDASSGSTERLTFGLCQLPIQEGDVPGNLALIEQSLAVHTQADLLCFPELPVTGYDYASAARQPIDERSVLSSLAQKYRKAIFSGYSLADGGQFFDACGVWNENGEQICEYRKIHLVNTEPEFFSSGSRVGLFEYRGWRMGTLICADLAFAELSKIMAVHDCSAILAASAWEYPYDKIFNLLGRARACENRMYMVSVNRAKGKKPFCGGSMAVDPDGVPIVESAGDGADYLQVTLERSAVGRARAEIPWLQIRRPDLYQAEMNLSEDHI